MIKYFLLFIIGLTQFVYAQQNSNYNTTTIDSILKVNANTIVRSNEMLVTIHSQNKMTVSRSIAITVLNEKGEKNISFSQGYSPYVKIKNIETVVFDKHGEEIKKIRKKDFGDFSNTDLSTIASDFRYKAFRYMGHQFPYTVEYSCEYESSSTGHLPTFYFLNGFNRSIEYSKFQIINETNIPIRHKLVNIDSIELKTTNSDKEIVFETQNIKAIKRELYTPKYTDIFPHVKCALNDFTLVDVSGSTTDWNSMGLWQYNNLLINRNELPKETTDYITDLVKNEENDIDKAKKIYEYVQSKTRYVSIQLGIGGWKPMLAEEVDKTGYGDCKALTNYTKALLDSQNIESYYSVIYGGNEIKSIDKDFVSIQGNHVILNLPNNGNDIWLECTSQTNPFGHIAGFTDNRNTLVVTPEGGVIKKTKHYTAEDNLAESNTSVIIKSDNTATGNFECKSQGIQYSKNSRIQHEKEKERYYNEIKFKSRRNLRTKNIHYESLRDSAVFVERFDFEISSFCNKAGNKLIFNPFPFSNTFNTTFKKDRKQHIVISRGTKSIDHYQFSSPNNFNFHKAPKPISLESKFGSYSLKIEKEDPENFRITREFKLNEGNYPPQESIDFNAFITSVKNYDKAKIILTKHL